MVRAGILLVVAALLLGSDAGPAPGPPLAFHRAASAGPAPSPALAAPGALEIHFIDVGQGNATLVVAPSGKALLVDSGERIESAAVAAYVEAVLGARRLDYIVVSHYHADHFGSYTDLLRNQRVGVGAATYDRGGDRDEYQSATYRDYFDFCTAEAPGACRRTSLREGDSIDLGPGVSAKVLCGGDLQLRVACGEPVVGENDNSLLILVSTDFLRVWIGGDTSGEAVPGRYADIETAAIGLGRVPPLDVYGVDHHGSCHSTNANLVAAATPTVSVFSVGANPYGHPCPDVEARLAGAASSLYYTRDASGSALDGSVVVSHIPGSHTFEVAGARGRTAFSTRT